MSRGVLRDSYDRVAGQYAERVGGELAGKPADRALLDALARDARGWIGDLGCGPGHVAAYLAGRGARVVGVDLSPGMLRHARVPVAAGDLAALPLADGCLAAAVALYSLIHLPPGTEAAALAEVRRVLAPGGTLLVAVHVGEETLHLDEWWGEPVSVDFRHFPTARVTGWLAEAGFTVTDVRERDCYPEVEAPTRRAYVTAGR